MGFNESGTSHFDGWALGKALRSLLKIKGSMEVPPKMNTEVLQPTVEVSQNGYAQYEKVGKSTNSALIAGNNQVVIVLAGPDPISSGTLDTRDKETLVMGLNWQYVMGVAAANHQLGYILQLNFNKTPGQPNAKLARSFYKYNSSATDTAYDFGIFGEFEDGITPGTNSFVNPQLGNKLWVPADAELQLIFYDTLAFPLNSILYYNIVGVQVPKNTALPQF